MSIISLAGREYPPETVWQAQEMYCVARMSYAQIEKEMGIAGSTLKRWGKQYEWRDKRQNLAQAESEIRADMVMARAGMIKELLDTKDPMIGFAVAKLEDVAIKAAKAEREGLTQDAGNVKPQRREINGPADAAEALQEAVEIKLARMLADPDEVDLKAVRAIKDVLALVEEMKPAGSKGKNKTKGITRESIEQIQKEILGM